MILTLTPALGRDYKTQAEVRKAWASGQDFRLEPSGVYISIRDLSLPHWNEPITGLQFRYNKLSRTFYLAL